MKNIFIVSIIILITTISGFAQTETETLNFIKKVITESTPGYRVSLSGSQISVESQIRSYYFNIKQITQISKNNRVLTLTVDIESTSGKGSKVDLWFANSQEANKYYGKLDNALTHLAKNYNGKYIYDVF